MFMLYLFRKCCQSLFTELSDFASRPLWARKSPPKLMVKLFEAQRLFLAAILFVSTGGASVAATSPLNFTRDVRPILANNCFHCHGPDADGRKADLRLDEWDSVGDI